MKIPTSQKEEPEGELKDLEEDLEEENDESNNEVSHRQKTWFNIIK